MKKYEQQQKADMARIESSGLLSACVIKWNWSLSQDGDYEQYSVNMGIEDCERFMDNQRKSNPSGEYKIRVILDR